MHQSLQLTFLLCFMVQFVSAQTNLRSASILATNTAIANEITVPFELVDGLIFVSGQLGGEPGNFVFDTGAPDLIVNSTYKKEGEQLKGLGVGGGINFQNIYIDDFAFAGNVRKGFAAYSTDMSHLESLTNRKIKGLIGYSYVKDYELFIDYDQWLITLVKHRTAVFDDVQVLETIPFTMYNHFPVIETEIGGETFRLGLDSGAEVNLIDISLKSSIKKKYTKGEVSIDLFGVDKSSQEVVSAIVKVTTIDGTKYRDMEYLFADISHLNDDDMGIDGLLGFPFLSTGKISINFKENKIYIWDTFPEFKKTYAGTNNKR